MSSSSRNNLVPLTIVGASGYTSVLSTRSLFMKANLSSGELPLYLKQTPDKSGVLKAETNWNLSLASNSRVNHYSNGDMEYDLRDFSSNKYDAYYANNRGQEAIRYTLSHDWSITDIAAEKDVMAVSTKGWTSFEKYTTDVLDYPIYSTYMSPVFYYPLPESTSETVTVYTFTIHWDTNAGSQINTPGNIVVGYTYNGQYLTDVTYVETDQQDDIGPLQATVWPPSISWTGDPDDVPNIEDPIYTTSTVTIVTPADLPNDAITIGNQYIRTSDLDPKLSRYIIPDISAIFKDQDRNWMNINSPDFEVPDYSDIYFRVVYDSSAIDPTQTKYLQPVVTSGNEEKLYQFGGFLNIQNFYDGLYDNALLTPKPTLDGDTNDLWYIITKDDGTYCFIGLSSYTTWDYSFDIDFPTPQTDLVTSDHIIVGWKKPSVRTSEIVKVAGFPNCGKVDLYFPKTGYVETFASGTNEVVSSNHGLSTGDRIKITEALGSGNTMNGVRYVSTISPNKFALYYDSSLSYGAAIYNTTTASGVRWSAVDGNTWGYNLTLYSPIGKNGYATTTQLRTSVEQPQGETPYDRAVESDTADKPQANLTGQRSWNNYYPYERFDSGDNIIFGVVNGNKFGADISLKKYGSNYILMVAEEGASESFQLISEYATKVTETVPQNKKVIPSYFPYGRIHFYTINPTARSVDYLTTYAPTDNPWAAYETINRQERLLSQLALYENKSLQISDINTYNYTTDDYWSGARYVQWSKDYVYNSELDFSFPNQNLYPYDYGFLDSLKSADFEISNNVIYCAAISNVKNADFANNLNLKNIDRYIRTLYFNISTPSSKTSNLIFLQEQTSTIVDTEIQKQEIKAFGNTVILQDNKLTYGWPSKFRTEEYIYTAIRNDASYSNVNIITSNGINGFGNYFTIDKNILITNKYNTSDENGNATTNPLQSLEIYRYDNIANRYYYVDSITPTINLSNSIYSNINTDTYELTTNVSYDGTSTNSATYIISLDGKYDLKDDCLVLRDWNEYVGFYFDYSSNTFKNKFHKFSAKSSQNSIIRLAEGKQSSFFDTSIEYDTGDYHQSLQIFDAVQIDENTLNNYVITMDTHYPNYVPLFLKTIEGYSSGVTPLYTAGNTSYATGAPLYIQPPMPYATGVSLFAKQTDIANTGMSLFHKSTSIATTGVDLFIRNGFTTGGLPLVFNSTERTMFPLYISHIVPTTLSDDDMDLFIYSAYTIASSPTPSSYNSYVDLLNNPVTPSNYFVMPMFISTIAYDDHANGLNLYLDSPGASITGSMSLYQNAGGVSGQVFNNRTLYTYGSGYKGNEVSNGTNLFIKCPITTQVPLFVYNTMTTGNIPLYVSGANVVRTGINLYCSGVHYPNSTVTLMIDGDL